MAQLMKVFQQSLLLTDWNLLKMVMAIAGNVSIYEINIVCNQLTWNLLLTSCVYDAHTYPDFLSIQHHSKSDQSHSIILLLSFVVRQLRYISLLKMKLEICHKHKSLAESRPKPNDFDILYRSYSRIRGWNWLLWRKLSGILLLLFSSSLFHVVCSH